MNNPAPQKTGIVGKLNTLYGRFIGWFLLVSLVPLIVVSLLSSKMSENALFSGYSKRLSVTGDAAGQLVKSILSGEKLQIEALTFNDLLHKDTYTAQVIKDLQTDLENTHKSLANYSEIFVLDSTGNIIASTSKERIGINRSQDSYFTQTKESLKPFIKDVYLSELTNQIGYVVAAPIINHSTGKFTGVVAARGKLEKINNALKETAAHGGATLDIFLVSTQGYVLTASRTLGEEVILKQKYQNQYLTDCFAGKESSTPYSGSQDYRGVTVIGSYNNVDLGNEQKWCLVAEIDRKEAIAPINQLNFTILLAGILSAIAVIFTAILASCSISNFIKQPMNAIVKNLIRAAEQLASSSQQSSASSQQTTSVAQQLATGATQQSKQSEEVSKAVTQLAAAIQQVSSSSQEVAQSAVKSSKDAQDAGVAGEKAIKSLDTIKNAIETTADLVKQTAVKSQSIGKIVKSITEVADQTNLLALNAAIEAARAGESGRGFAVVADEVRKLAKESKESAEEITKLIEDALASVDETVTKTEESINVVNTSAEIINGSLQGIQGITSTVQKISNRIQEVSAAAQQQAAAVQQISKTMESIAAVSQQNSAGAQQLTSSTQQQSAVNQQVAAAAQQLQQTSIELQKLVGLAGEMSDKVKDLETTIHAKHTGTK